MKNKFTILGCGSSLGVPWINNYWGNCDPKNLKNKRTRCSAHFQFNDLSVLIDTSPDIKEQIRKNNIKNVDAVIYTHEHSDQTSGIFELRPYFWLNKKKIDIFASKKTMKELKKKYDYIFKKKHGYVPIGKDRIIKKNFFIQKKKTKIKIKAFEVPHGLINSTVFIFKKIAYLSDCSFIPSNLDKHLKNLNYLIIDCLKYSKHPGHLNYNESIEVINRLKPKKAILTNLFVDLDYNNLKKNLPQNILPAYDGMSFTF